MEIAEIRKKIEAYKAEGKKVFTTSSFQTHSIVLLHIISEIDETIPIYFINTGYLFPETISFRDQVTKKFGLSFVDLKPNTPKYMQRESNGKLMFTTDPDHCCYLNKTQPLEPYLMQYDIWISGVRADQSSTRKKMKTEQQAPFNTTRFHPILDWSPKQIYDYRKLHNLPEHPLDKEGYLSIGCSPCTQKMDLSDERSARWFGMNKTECGLHKDLITK